MAIKMRSNNLGFTLVEVMISVGFVALTALAFSGVYSWYSKTTGALTTQLDREVDISTGNDFLIRSLARSRNSFDVVHIPDDNEKSFFDFFPNLPVQCSNIGNESRQLTLELGQKTEIYFLELDKDWNRTIFLDPTRPLNTVGDCIDNQGEPITSGAPIASFNYLKDANKTNVNEPGLMTCLKNYQKYDFKKTDAQIDSLTESKELFYFFRLPDYYSTVGKSCHLQPYFYLSQWDGSTFKDLRSPHFIESQHPTRLENGSLQAVSNLNYFIGKMPFSAGASSAFMVDRVRLVLYKIEPIEVQGRSTAGLFRYYLSSDTPTGDLDKQICKSFGSTQLCATKRISISQGINKVIFSRPSVQNSTIQFSIVKDLQESSVPNSSTQTKALTPKSTEAQ